MDRNAEKIKARKSREARRWGKVRKTEATSKTLGVKGGRFLAHPRLFGNRAVGIRQARIAQIRFAEEVAA
jgi:hypothetical protein